jgi:cell wall-associated NlpC family hydrolase
VGVPVATLWVAPDLARPVDEPSLTGTADVARWVASMDVAQRRELVGRVATQALYGDRVEVLERRGAWSRVVVPGQPTSLDPRGYPGWLPNSQLDRPPAGGARTAVVTRPVGVLRDVSHTGRALGALSFGTRLPAVAADPDGVTVALPGGGEGWLAAPDVAVVDPVAPPRPTSDEVVRTAELFSGVPYLWGGTSSAAFDCSGFTSLVYGASGVVLPRDAADQAAAGTPVDRSQLRPGDLLFFSTGRARESIHHVAMYVGYGRMIQAPATGRAVETVAVGSAAWAGGFWGARRYIT